jgi:transcriptional regulator
MYIPAHFEETRIEILHELMRNHPLATLVTLGSNGLNANHIPLELDPEPTPFGTLRGHVARANPVWQDFNADVEAMVIFQGANSYISPSWYATKKETGKVVPTWNYAVVHAYGALKIIEDKEWLRNLIERLTNHHEAEKETPWKVSDAPENYINPLLNAIVGIEIPITKISGKWKVSQNQSHANRIGVIDGLRELKEENAETIAAVIESHAPPSK